MMRKSYAVLVAQLRPHLHRIPCAICDAAEDVKNSKATPVIENQNSCSSLLTLTFPLASGDMPMVCDTVEESRRCALLSWLKRFPFQRSAANTDAQPPERKTYSPADWDRLWNRFLSSSEENLIQDGVFKEVLSALDVQCRRSDSQAVGDKMQEAANSEEMVPIPDFLVVPKWFTGTPQGHDSVNAEAGQALGDEVASGPSVSHVNTFEKYVREAHGMNGEALNKQLSFQKVLLSIQAVFDAIKLRFFLACGTALGAHRNGYFIPHDEDVDVGVFYADLASPALGSEGAELERAQLRIYELVAELAKTGDFMVFDICGEVGRGLELRVLHLSSGVRVDINVYYPSIPQSDDALVLQGGPFVWAASFYEAAAQRRYGMYRYRHLPFDGELVQLKFCCQGPNDVFLVPPKRYLMENYGADWATPEEFSYTEGLAGKFTNIIPE